jgi:hypothetical protein
MPMTGPGTGRENANARLSPSVWNIRRTVKVRIKFDSRGNVADELL